MVVKTMQGKQSVPWQTRHSSHDLFLSRRVWSLIKTVLGGENLAKTKLRFLWGKIHQKPSLRNKDNKSFRVEGYRTRGKLIKEIPH